MEIDNGAISIMMTAYVDLLPEWGDYLTDKEKIHPKRLEQFIYNLAYYEEEHFQRRGVEEQEQGWRLSSENEDEEEDFYGEFYEGKPTPLAAVSANVKGSSPPATNVAPFEFESLKGDSNNVIRSYRDFYYASKMGWTRADKDFALYQRRAHVRDYLEGLHWVLNYYHHGCMSWDWFFPHLYAPLSTDMVNLDEFYEDDCPSNERGFKAWKFDKGKPFPSLAQLLSVLPPQSADLLPKPLGKMMLEPFSPIIEYYPADFESDPNGKRQPWEAIVKIPFIDSEILLDSLNEVLSKDEAATSDDERLLSNSERLRNVPGNSHLFLSPNRGAPERKAIAAQALASVAGPVRQSRRKGPSRRGSTYSRNPRRPQNKRG